VIAYKFLRSDGTGVFTRFRWPLPNGGPGAWVDAHIDPCVSGIHACRLADLPLWAGRTLYEIELDGEVLEESMKVVATRGRLLRRGSQRRSQGPTPTAPSAAARPTGSPSASASSSRRSKDAHAR
jgi:hypothetical protein